MSWWAVIVLAMLVTSIVIYLVWRLGVRAHRNPYVSGREAVLGHIGEARTDLDPTGRVFVDGTLWNATAEHEGISRGEKVVVINMIGLQLIVRRHEE